SLAERADPDQEMIAMYDGEIRYTDDEMNLLLDAVEGTNRLAGILTIITSDHGEGLTDHGYPFHSLYLYEEAVRVPLVFAWPGRIPAGRRVPAIIEQMDVLPTVVSLLKLSVISENSQVSGRDASAVLLGEAEPDENRVAFTQRREYLSYYVDHVPVSGSKWSVRRANWKLIVAPEEATRIELYDLDQDPGELKNVAEREPETVKQLLTLITEWRARQAGGPLPSSREVAPEDVQRLKAMGYFE
ncbi:MAG: sulfatase/phosphatase domain-containing protein, partial [Phycisphaerae bacterium]